MPQWRCYSYQIGEPNEVRFMATDSIDEDTLGIKHRTFNQIRVIRRVQLISI